MFGRPSRVAIMRWTIVICLIELNVILVAFRSIEYSPLVIDLIGLNDFGVAELNVTLF